MGAIETYNARVDYQGELDELFPAGAFVTVLDEFEDGLIPTGIEFTVGRVFCSNATETELGWYYELFLDGRSSVLQVHDYVQPLLVWIALLDLENDVYAQAEALQIEDEPLTVLRLGYDPQGPRRPAPGQRKLLTQLRETELFPHGITHRRSAVADV